MADEAHRSYDREEHLSAPSTLEQRSSSRRQFMSGALGVAGASLGSGALMSACKNLGQRTVDVQSPRKVEAKLQALGLVLPQPFKFQGMALPYSPVRLRGNRAYISGHVPLNEDGTVAEPLGRVGAEVSVEQGYKAARLVALAHLGSLKRALGDLDRVTAWLRVFAMVNVAPGFNKTPLVTNGYSDLILELYGSEVGSHARSSIGMFIPLNAPVNCEAEVEIDGPI